MLKDIFNKTVQAGEDVYYGMMLPTMAASRKMRLNLWGGLGVALGVAGVATNDMQAIGLSVASLASTAFCFGEAGSRLRKAAEATPQPKL